ncbi:MAG: aminotransferase class IV [Phaeodactylibacter sp.]|nr:aminotransferase class IV [Phaeodactylibacter sp.]MCB9274851.1 aminotransferase class IV [Lewinellaceae bacterium]
MSRLLLETIRCQDGQLDNLPYHQERLLRSRRELLGLQGGIRLEDIQPPEEARHGLFKCRVIYAEQIESIEFLPYTFQPLNSLKLVDCGPLSYSYKYADRKAIEKLYRLRGRASDVLFLRRGLLTDTSHANIALFDGHKWFTPARPLLAGTRRAALIDAGLLLPVHIRAEELPHFKELRLINAMARFEDERTVPLHHVAF